MNAQSTNKINAINPHAIYALGDAFENIKNEFIAEAQLRKIELAYVSDDLHVAYWDWGCLRHAFIQVLTHVLHASTGGGRLVFSVKKTTEHDVMVTISSSGNFAYDLTTDYADEQSCVKAHGGKFGVVNDSAQGIAFNIELPLYALCIQ